MSTSSASISLVPIRFGAYPTPLPPKRLVSFGPGTSLRDRQVTTGSANISQHGGKAAARMRTSWLQEEEASSGLALGAVSSFHKN